MDADIIKVSANNMFLTRVARVGVSPLRPSFQFEVLASAKNRAANIKIELGRVETGSEDEIICGISLS